MALIEDAIPSRRFLVVYKEDLPGSEITGTEALAKLLEVPHSQIPIIRLWKYSVGDYVVYERDRNPRR